MDKNEWIKNKVPNFLKILLAFLIIIASFAVVLYLVYSNAIYLINNFEQYRSNLNNFLEELNYKMGMDVLKEINHLVANFDYKDTFFAMLNISTGIITAILMILIYCVFIFLEEASVRKKIRKLFRGTEFDNIYDMYKKIEFSVSRYLGLKTLISFLTGLTCYIVLLIFQIDSAIFWAFIVFIFNFIPVLGSIVAVVFPVFFSFLQYGSIYPGLLILFLLINIHFFIGNFLEPRVMANTVNLSPIVIILSLTFWGMVWGIVGMFLSVPLTGVFVIVLSKFDKTKPIAILLSSNGEIE